MTMVRRAQISVNLPTLYKWNSEKTCYVGFEYKSTHDLKWSDVMQNQSQPD